MGVDGFRETLKRHYPETDLTRADVAAAFHNLAGFLDLLIRVNDRERLVPLDAAPRERAKERCRAGQ
jgi:hypothetical protein